jgi:hypothetical protein
MTTELKADIRPRTTGELLDDAVRLSLADGPLLLVLSGLFLVPAAIVMLFVLTLPRQADPWRSLGLPAVAALLVPLTGLGSGACQELFRRRADETPVTLHGCLRGALGRGMMHIAARALALAAGLLGLTLLILPGLAIWMFTAAVHPLLAERDRGIGEAFSESARTAQRNAAKIAAIGFGRLAVALFVVLNLHILLRLGLWVVGNLAGLDVALLAAELELGNPAYLIVLLLLAWWLLAPLAEACNYLLHVDTRVRYEGLDLWYRVQRRFPAVARSVARPAALLLVVLLMGGATARAADHRAEAISAARQEISRIIAEVKQEEPYLGSAHWQGRLRAVADELKRASAGKGKRYAWLDKIVDDFARHNRQDALRVLENIDKRLALMEESFAARDAADSTQGPLSPEQTRKLLPDKPPPREETKKRPENPARKKRDETIEIETKSGRGSAAAPGVAIGGFGMLGWLMLAGLLAACLVFAVMLYLQHRKMKIKAAPKVSTGESAQALETVAADLDQVLPATLWQQADELAQQGNFLEAVRRLYLAVLALLHRARLIRYEKTRTNGEYIRQVRLAPEAPRELHAPFGELTRRFDQKWYGERACSDGDYGSCRALAEQVRIGITT